jgi:hypothetical protein
MDKSDAKLFSRDSQHQEKPYFLAKGKEKCDRKALKKYGFQDIVSFALVDVDRDSLYIQNAMPKEVAITEKQNLGVGRIA